MKIKKAIAALVLASTVMAGQTSAACVATDIAGTWITHMVYVDSTGVEGSGWGRCKLIVSSTGVVTPTSSQCIFDDGVVNVVSVGSLKVGATCIVNGSVALTQNGVNEATLILKYGLMDRSHDSFTALGYDKLAPEFKLSFQAVKQ